MKANYDQLSHVLKALAKIDDEQRFSLEICKILKEAKTTVIRNVVKHLPREAILQVLQETIEVQTSGGMETFVASQKLDLAEQPMPVDFEPAQTSRKKTSGGVFMTLVKRHPAMTQDIKRKL